MRITFVGHASILVESGGVSVLSDPWWRGPCFGAQWWNYPDPYIQPVEARRVDYIYVSHGHHDHLHPATLNRLNKDAKVLISDHTGLASPIRDLGFQVIEVADTDTVPLGKSGMTCRIIETCAADTLMTLTDGTEVCVNLNDALHAAPHALQREFVARLKALHPRIDYLFCGYGVASHFPNCYVIPGKDREATASRRQRYFNRQWARLIAELQPVYGFPFAADVVFLEEDLFWANEATHNTERPTETLAAMYPGCPAKTIDIAPGFVIDSGHVTNAVLRQPVLAATLRTSCASGIEHANRYRIVDDEDVNEVAGLLRERLDAWADYLRGYEGDYRFLIRFRNAESGLCIEKRGHDLSLEIVRVEPGQRYDVIYTTRLPYLKGALTRPFGDEILFVGSGGVFEYSDQSKARKNLHRELMPLLRSDATPSRSRGRAKSGLAFKAKQVLKRILGRQDPDLYDLGTWTVFRQNRS